MHCNQVNIISDIYQAYLASIPYNMYKDFLGDYNVGGKHIINLIALMLN